MDPLSIIAGTTGTVAFAITSAMMLSDFIGKILDAPNDVADIARDVDALAKILNTLQGWLEKDVIRPSAARSLVPSLNSCVTSMNRLRSAIQPYTKLNPSNHATFKWRSFGWTFRKQEIRDLRDKLHHGKTTLSISIGIINTYAIESGNQVLSKQIESGNDAIRNEISNLHEDFRNRKERKIDLASVGGEHGSLFNGTDTGIPLRRYLEDLPPMSHPWAGASEIGEILSLRSLQVNFLPSMDDGDSRPPTRTASPSVIYDEPHALPSILSPLHRATEEDDIRKVMELLAAGADVNEKGADGRTPLHICAKTNNIVMAEVLLYKSASIDSVDQNGKEPLRTALESGAAEMACMLIPLGCLDALSGFILDMAQREHSGSEKLLLKKCFACAENEGKDDLLVAMLSMSTDGAPADFEDSLLQILHDAGSRDEMVGLAKVFADRKVKHSSAISEQARENDREGDSIIQAGHLRGDSLLTAASESYSKAKFDIQANQTPNEPSSPEAALGYMPENDTISKIISFPTTVSDPLTQTDKISYDGNDGRKDHDIPNRSIFSSKKNETLVELTPVEQELLDSPGIKPRSIDSEIDTPVTSDLSVLDNGHSQPFLHKQFSWETSNPDDAIFAAIAGQRTAPEQAKEMLIAPLSLPAPPAGPVFNIPLQALCEREQDCVPRIVLECISVVERSASSISGIYGLPASLEYVEELVKFTETDSRITHFPKSQTVSEVEHAAAVAILLKQFLGDLPDSLLPSTYYDVLMGLGKNSRSVLLRAEGLKEEAKRLEQLKSLIYALPVNQYATLRVVMQHLKQVSDNREKALRPSYNKDAFDPTQSDLLTRGIATIFAPLLMRRARSNESRDKITDREARISILKSIINDCSEFLYDKENKLNVPDKSKISNIQWAGPADTNSMSPAN